jgi:hypothetical protein
VSFTAVLTAPTPAEGYELNSAQLLFETQCSSCLLHKEHQLMSTVFLLGLGGSLPRSSM